MNALVRLEIRLASVLEEHVRRQIRRRAIKRAFQRFSRLHPEWHQSTFDEWFLSRLPEGLLETQDSAALALEWTRQFRYRNERQRERDAQQLTAIADSFLALLADAQAELESRSRMGSAKPIATAVSSLSISVPRR
jgi:hypothetical protein